MKPLLEHATSRGPVLLCVDGNGTFHVTWKGESVAQNRSAAAAIDDAANGGADSASDGTDVGTLGLSDDPREWRPLRPGAHAAAGLA